MPYIKQETRKYFDTQLEDIASRLRDKGDLTYCLYKLCSLHLKQFAKSSYTTLSMIMSCLEDAKLEWYRQRMAPYEDIKIKENGGID